MNAALRLVAFAGAGAAVLASAPPAFAADQLNDPHRRGGMTFCDSHGKAITSGTYSDAPFAAKVLSDYVPPAPNDAANSYATLFVFAPRQGTDPGNWSGEPLTAASQWTDRKHPTAEVLPGDITFSDVKDSIPGTVDDLLQVRMYFKVPNRSAYRATYAAVNVRFLADRWELADPVSIPCATSSAVSVARKFQTPAATPAATSGTGSPAPGGSATAAPGSSSASAAALPSGSTSASPSVASDSGSASKGLSAGAVTGLVVGGLVLVGAGAFTVRRQRS